MRVLISDWRVPPLVVNQEGSSTLMLAGVYRLLSVSAVGSAKSVVAVAGGHSKLVTSLLEAESSEMARLCCAGFESRGSDHYLLQSDQLADLSNLADNSGLLPLTICVTGKAATLAAMSPEDRAAAVATMSAEDKVVALKSMSAEAKAAALAAISSEDRAATLAAMSVEEKAAALSGMSSEDKTAALAAMTPEDSEATWGALRMMRMSSMDEGWDTSIVATLARVTFNTILFRARFDPCWTGFHDSHDQVLRAYTRIRAIATPNIQTVLDQTVRAHFLHWGLGLLEYGDTPTTLADVQKKVRGLVPPPPRQSSAHETQQKYLLRLLVANPGPAAYLPKLLASHESGGPLWSRQERSIHHNLLSTAANQANADIVKWLVDNWSVSFVGNKKINTRIVALGIDAACVGNPYKTKKDNDGHHFELVRVLLDEWDGKELPVDILKQRVKGTADALIYMPRSERLPEWELQRLEQDPLYLERIDVLKLMIKELGQEGCPPLYSLVLNGKQELIDWMIDDGYLDLHHKMTIASAAVKPTECPNCGYDTNNNLVNCGADGRFHHRGDCKLMYLLCGHVGCCRCMLGAFPHPSFKHYDPMRCPDCPCCSEQMILIGHKPFEPLTANGVLRRFDHAVHRSDEWLHSLIDQDCSVGSCILALATCLGSLRLLSWLKQKGFDVNEQYAGFNLMHIAIRSGQLSSVKWLAENGAAHLMTEFCHGRRAIHEATLHTDNRVETMIVTFLMQKLDGMHGTGSLKFGDDILSDAQGRDWMHYLKTTNHRCMERFLPKMDKSHAQNELYRLTREFGSLVAIQKHAAEACVFNDWWDYSNWKPFLCDIVIRCGRMDVLRWLCCKQNSSRRAFGIDSAGYTRSDQFRVFVTDVGVASSKYGVNQEQFETYIAELDAQYELCIECHDQFTQIQALLSEGADAQEIERLCIAQDTAVEQQQDEIFNCTRYTVQWKTHPSISVLSCVLHSVAVQGHGALVEWQLRVQCISGSAAEQEYVRDVLHAAMQAHQLGSVKQLFRWLARSGADMSKAKLALGSEAVLSKESIESTRFEKTILKVSSPRVELGTLQAMCVCVCVTGHPLLLVWNQFSSAHSGTNSRGHQCS